MLILAALLLQSQTVCTTNSGITTCNTRPHGIDSRPLPPVDYSSPRLQIPQNLGPAFAAKRARGRQKKVGKLLAAGKCDEAIAYALSEGEFEMVSFARGYCGKP